MSNRFSVLDRGSTYPILSLSGISKTYRDSWGRRSVALTDVSLSAARGETFGLLGPNGAGKSTTFKIILGLLRPTSGSGTLLGDPLGSLAAREEIGFLPENPYFYDYLTPREFLDTCGNLSGMSASDRKQRIPELLERVGLRSDENRRLKKFSKGMLQRVGLAQALIHDPDLLILDEPMSGLDPAGRSLFRDILLDLKRQGKTVIFASHILPDVEAVCDRVAILVEGRVRRVGSIDELVSPQASNFEIEAADVPESLFGAWERDNRARRAGTRVLVEAKSQAEMETTVGQVFSAHAALVGVRRRQSTLEEVVLEEMRHKDSDTNMKRGAA